jgi:hypothetical protein
MATTLTSLGALTAAATGATPAVVTLNATFGAASMTAQTTGTNQLFNFVNNGAIAFVVYNTVASGSNNTWEPIMFPTTSGAAGGPGAPLGVTIPITAMTYTTTAIVGAFLLGPFPTSKFNDTNGLCWINQVGAGIVTSYVGAFAIPTAVT